MNVQGVSRSPAVLSREAVRTALRFVRTLSNRADLSTVCACGPHLQAALHLKACDIDSHRMMIHVHRGKSAKDRVVPLPNK